MNQLKAVVLEKNGSMVTILGADGSFQKIRYRNSVEIGSEIVIPTVQSRQPFWRIAVSVAAVFLLVLIGSTSWNYYQATTAVAMISIDINPRLQLTLDRKGRVLQLESLNPDAERVLAGLPLKGEPWNQALSDIIGHSVTLHYLNPEHQWVLVGYSPVKVGSIAPEGVTSDDITQRIESAAQAQGMDPKIAVYQMTAEDQTKAQASGLTLGEYALMNTAQKVGIKADANTVKNTTERVKLLDQPQVQEQLHKDNRVKEKVSPDSSSSAGDSSNAGANSKGTPGNNGNPLPGKDSENNPSGPSRHSSVKPGQETKRGNNEQDEQEKDQEKEREGQGNSNKAKDRFSSKLSDFKPFAEIEKIVPGYLSGNQRKDGDDEHREGGEKD